MSKKLKDMVAALASAAGQFNAEEVERVSGNIMQHIDDNIATHPKGFVTALENAVNAFDRETADQLCNKLISHLHSRPRPYPFPESKKILSVLRKKRHFELIAKSADTLIQSGRNEPTICRQYAQALIDQGHLTAGLDVLYKLKEACKKLKNNVEFAQAVGLIGRAHKQIYINASTERKPGALVREHLAQAIDSYLEIYKKDNEQTWHGVNGVALIARAKRDRVTLNNKMPEADVLGKKVLKTVVSHKKPDMWQMATAAEACLGTKDYAQSLDWIAKYTNPANKGADAFEYASTLRQFEEVWQLDDGDKDQGRILHLLRSALLRSEGGRVEFENQAPSLPELTELRSDKEYEKILGKDRYRSFKWYLTGLERAAGVVQICDRLGNGFGSGFVLRGQDVHEQFKDHEWVLITNAHVVSNEPSEQNSFPGSSPSDEVIVRFEASENDQEYEVDKVLYSSPRHKLDCTILSFNASADNLPEVKPFRIAKKMPLVNKSQRVYVIGHPKGGALSFSIDDNLLIDHESPKVHYRAPTEGGSSGSPVFNQNWDLIALHHSGGLNMKKLNGGTGSYPANEGLWIQSILEAVRNDIDASG